MHLARCHRLSLLGLTLIALLYFPGLWPSIKLYYCIPFIVVCFYQLSLVGSLWAAMACGALVDSLSVHSFFGLNALVYCLSTLLLYPQRFHFFADRISTLPLMTFLFSFTSTILFLICASLLESKKQFSWQMIATDLTLMPALDGLYALIYFVLPYKLFSEIRRYKKRTYYSSKRYAK